MRFHASCALALALVMGAGAALAATFNVTNDATLTSANNSVFPGDIVLLSPGTYTGAIAPARSGLAFSPIVYMGATGDSSAVKVGGITLKAKSYVTVKWLRNNGPLSMECPGVGETDASIRFVQPVGDSIYFVRQIGPVAITGASDFTLQSMVCGVGNTPTNGGFEIVAATKQSGGGGYPSVSQPAGLDIEIRSMNGLVQDVRAYYGGSSGSATGNHAYVTNMQGCTFRRFAFLGYFPTVGSGAACMISYRTMWNTFEDCSWRTKNTSAANNCHLFFLRDSSSFNTFTRDTIENLSTSTREVLVNISGSGTVTGPETSYGNTFDACVFRGDFEARWQSWFRRGRVVNTIINTTHPLITGFGTPNTEWADSMVFEHNTVHAPNAAMAFDQSGTRLSNASIRYNIFSCGTTSWAVIKGVNRAPCAINFNLYYTPTPGDSTKCVATTEGGGFTHVGPSDTWCTSSGFDCNSRWGNPAFVDAAGGNFALGSGSLALGLGPDGYAGAIAPASTDTERPAPIATLATSSPTPSTITLSWTAVGDDSLTGTATSYQIRRNFGSAITSEGVWNAATVVSSPPTPQVAGSAETKLVTGLSQASNYYFAVRAVDEAGHVGALSNSPLGTTAPDVTRPAPITTLTATPIAPNVVRLNWTAVGDDSLTGQGTFYEVRRALTPITTTAEWNAATVVTFTLGANTAGTAEVYSVPSLLPATTYYFNVRVLDEALNQSALSNSPGATTFDNVLPATVSDLNVKGTTGTSATLSWTSPGDDGAVGTAAFYEVRYRLTSPIVTEGDWVTSTNVTSGVPTPQAAGNDEEITIGGLTSDRTYYFAVRATDESGNRGAISNSPVGVTLDITAPAQITTLTPTGAGQTFVSIRWTAVGDDGATGTAAATLGRYTTAGPITNEVAWAAATAIPGMPAPQVAGTVQSVSVSGLASGVTYHFAVRSIDEAGNAGAISNSVSRTTVPSDVLRPAAPSIVASAWPGVADGARVIFSAVGDDSLGGGPATSYTLRYRKDAGLTTLGSSAWDAQSLVSRTYRIVTPQTPKSPGLQDTIFVRGLRPGETLWFALKVTDDFAQASAMSNVDTVTIPARPAVQYAQPARWLYQGAGPGTVPPSFPYVTLAGAIDTAMCRAASLFDGSSFCPEFADSAGPYGAYVPLAAWQTMRAMNPTFRIAGEPLMNAVYIRTPTDSSLAYDYRSQAWRAARIAGGGWTPGSGAPPQQWVPGNYTDSTGTRWLLWTNVPGYKGWLYQTYNFGRSGGVAPNYDVAKAGVPGLSNWNLNIAYQPTPGSFPVADSVADVASRHFITRRNPDGSWTYDEIRWDLSGMDASFSALQYENIDHVRAGYATKAAFDSAWAFAANRIMARLRSAAVDAGRPDFIITGNGGSTSAYDYANGWMNEGFPSQQGGSWFSNMYWVVGGMMRDRLRHAWTPYSGVTFSFECLTSLCDPPTLPDSAATRKRLRYGLGTAAIAGGLHAFGPAPASGPRGGNYMTWGFDEYAVDTISSVAQKGRAGSGYLGTATTPIYYTAPTIYAGGDRAQGRGTFETATPSSWWATSVSAPSGQGSITTVTDTVDAGSRSLRMFVGTKQDADWRVSLNPAVFGYATIGQTIVVTFRARTERACALQVHAVNKSFAERASWANGSAITIEPGGWNTYRIVGTATATDSIGPSIWAAVDSSALVYIDGLTLHVGGARGGSAVREFRRGAVIVNPQAYADTVTFGRYVRRITAASGRPADVNTGALLAPGSPIIVPAQDARFVLFPLDSIRPSRVLDLVASGAGLAGCTVSWTAPGNDSTSGTAMAYEFRRSPLPIVTETDWSNAAPITPAPTPAVAGSAEAAAVTGLSSASVYWFAVRAYDAAGYVGAISNTDSVTTLAPTAPDPCVEIARPGKVVDLIASWPGVKYVRLTLTKPGPRQFVGSIDSVRTQIRRSASPITSDAEWNAATVVLSNITPLGLAVGSNGAITDTVVALAGTWWYAWRDSNTTSHLVGCLSNTDSVTAAPDSCEFYGRPGIVTDLVARGDPSIAGQVTIELELPGDWRREGDGDVTTLEVRRALAPITTIAEWNAATLAYEELVQNIGAPGSHAEIPIGGLPEGVASWFAVRATNATSGLTSCLSNTDSATAALPPGDPPIAAFSAVPSSGGQPLTVACQDHSAGSPTLWEWYARRISDEAEPQLSTEQNPSFVFARTGAYLISLQVYNADGSDTASAVVNVACTPPSPMLNISGSAVNTTSIALVYKEPGADGDVGSATLIEVRYVEGATFTVGQWAAATPVSGVPIPTFGGASAGVVVPGLLPGKTYSFTARATDVDGCLGDFGAVATISTMSGSQRAVSVTVGLDRRVRVRVGGRR